MSSILYLASGSARRKEILSRLGISYTVVVADVDESIFPGESPMELVVRLGLKKAQALQGKFNDGFALGADTTVEFNGESFGKPLDDEDAFSMLMKFSDAVVRIHTGHALVNLKTNQFYQKMSTSEVHFKKLDPQAIRDYVKTGEPKDKAGSFAIQGLGGIFIESTSGSYSNIMGLDEEVVKNWYNAYISK